MDRINNYENTATAHNKQSCAMCYQMADASIDLCCHCGALVHPRKKNSLQNTVALLVTSIVLYIPANVYPIMITTYLGEATANTIIGGVIKLWDQGSYPIAAIIFIASVMVPVVKIIALGWLCYSVKAKRIYFFRNNHKMYRLTEFIGRWSMVDIFVVTVLVAMIQMGNLMNVMPGKASIAFAAMVITTMLAAFTFDPRLIWAGLDQKSRSDQKLVPVQKSKSGQKSETDKRSEPSERQEMKKGLE